MDKITPRSSGIYGLFRLDGVPIAAADAHALTMEMPPAQASWSINGHDGQAMSTVHRHDSDAGATLLVGEIADSGNLATRLGLTQSAPIAHIAQVALQRFGAETPVEMLGEWSLFHRSRDGHVTLMAGPGTRDRLHYALSGPHLAVAPNLFILARLQWVGTQLDEVGLLMPLARAHIREYRMDHTMLAGVRWLRAGHSAVIKPDGSVALASANALTVQPRWHGNFADAVAESEALLRKIMRERLGSAQKLAVLLSGGLDSSLLAWLTAEERVDQQIICALSSAAPDGSGIADETGFARQVADHLRIGFTPVVAEPSANFFRPPEAVLSGASGPFLSTRHCLTEAFQAAAKSAGAKLMINGTFGEMTATGYFPAMGMAQQLRSIASRLIHGVRGSLSTTKSETGHFHVRLAAHRLANLPEPIIAAMSASQRPEPPRSASDHSGLVGYLPGTRKSLVQANEFYPGAIRMDYPFRDIRLYRLFAGFPVEMLLKATDDRPVVRSMLKGRLPDAIVSRRRGMPAEPDRFHRMQRQALDARERIAVFRKAEVDDWIDLDWLDAALLRIATKDAITNDEGNEVQLTAMAAEFLCWWRGRS